MMNTADVIAELNRPRDEVKDMELEVKRLVACYMVSSPEDRRVVWAALNKYAPYADHLQARGTL